jgi:hypothetical protein
MIAAGRLQAMMESRTPSMLNIWVRMNRIMNAIHDTVPEKLWPEILRKVDEAAPALPAGRPHPFQEIYD